MIVVYAVQAVKLEQNKLIPLITSARDLLHTRRVVDKLMKHCEGIATDMGSIIAELTSTTTLGEEAKDQGYIVSQPKCMNEKYEHILLLFHVLVKVDSRLWCLTNHKSCCNLIQVSW